MESRNVLVLVHILLPVILIFTLAYTAFSATDDLFTTGFILNSLIVYFPAIFLLQGIASALLKSNIFLSLGTSTLAFIVVLIIWLNSSAIWYIFVYIIIGLIGYGVTRWVQKRAMT